MRVDARVPGTKATPDSSMLRKAQQRFKEVRENLIKLYSGDDDLDFTLMIWDFGGQAVSIEGLSEAFTVVKYIFPFAEMLFFDTPPEVHTI